MSDNRRTTRVAALRKLRGVSAALMADATGMSQSSWYRFERGVRAGTLEEWINTAWMLGAHVEDLVGEKRLRQWTPTDAFPDQPGDPSLGYWKREPDDYDDVLEYLDEVAPEG